MQAWAVRVYVLALCCFVAKSPRRVSFHAPSKARSPGRQVEELVGGGLDQWS